jgi:transcription-repair coupling factor (superfamily II helicase)
MSVYLKAIENLPEISELCELAPRGPVNLIGAPEGAKAHVLSAFLAKTGKRAMVVSPSEAAAKEFARELSLFTGKETAYLPAADITLKPVESASYDLTESRIKENDLKLNL